MPSYAALCSCRTQRQVRSLRALKEPSLDSFWRKIGRFDDFPLPIPCRVQAASGHDDSETGVRLGQRVKLHDVSKDGGNAYPLPLGWSDGEEVTVVGFDLAMSGCSVITSNIFFGYVQCTLFIPFNSIEIRPWPCRCSVSVLSERAARGNRCGQYGKACVEHGCAMKGAGFARDARPSNNEAATRRGLEMVRNTRKISILTQIVGARDRT